MYLHTNYIQIAIDRIGGPTKAANVMCVSNATIHNWVKAGAIHNIDKARLMAKLADLELQQLRGTR